MCDRAAMYAAILHALFSLSSKRDMNIVIHSGVPVNLFSLLTRFHGSCCVFILELVATVEHHRSVV